jgi:hypothetical protein
MDAEEVSRHVNAVVQASQNDLLTKLDGLMSTKLHQFESKFSQSQREMSDAQCDKIQQGFLSADNYKFSKRSCEEQFKFNSKVVSSLYEAREANKGGDGATTHDKISQGIELLDYRQKLVKLADSSEAGWKTVDEYVSNPIADNSDDEKRMDRARVRANRKVKAVKTSKGAGRGRFHPYRASSTPPAANHRGPPGGNPFYNQQSFPTVKTGTCYGCGLGGHWRRECPSFSGVQATVAGVAASNKISTALYMSGVGSVRACMSGGSLPVRMQEDVVSVDSVPSNVTQSVKSRDISPIGRLRNRYTVWKEAGACEAVLGIIDQGYRLPFKEIPVHTVMNNNKSARDNPGFVEKEISKLVDIGSVSEVFNPPLVVNPLTVAYNREGKARLVLDCRHVNPCLHKFKFKYEDAVVARDVLGVGYHVFTFDLKSAYHHIEIWDNHRHYLGFSWIYSGEVKYFVFNVLPFGIATAGYIFTKVLREVVRFWRSKGIHIVMYLDDGIGGDIDYQEAVRISNFVRESLLKFGFLIADEKCDWQPSSLATWLGYTWDMAEGVVRVTSARLDRLLVCLNNILFFTDQGRRLFKARRVAGIVGQVISMHSVFGNQVRLRTRCLYTCVLTRASWNACVLLSNQAICELRYWVAHAAEFNGQGSTLKANGTCTSTVTVCTDASDAGYGGFVRSLNGSPGPYTLAEGGCDVLDGYGDVYGEPLVLAGIPDLVGHMSGDTDCQFVVGTWDSVEAQRSSTWRELEAAKRVLYSVKGTVHEQNVKLVMDSKNACSIVHKGSKKPDLQNIALDVFDLCTTENASVHSQWIPRSLNMTADFLSRCSDCDDWGVQSWVFKLCDARWGAHSVDRFACDYNTKCLRFNSRWWCSGSESVDAFTVCWANDNNWLVPPPRLVPKVVSKLKLDKAVGTLIVPEWRSAPFWPELCHDGVQFGTMVTDHLLLGRVDVTIPGRGNNGIFASKSLNFGMLALRFG